MPSIEEELTEGNQMKGPGERLKYDLRRLWECPVCRHRERTGGDLPSRLCGCQEQVEPVKRQWMKLVEDGPRRNPDPKPIVVPPLPGVALVPPLQPAEEQPAEEQPAENGPQESTTEDLAPPSASAE